MPRVTNIHPGVVAVARYGHADAAQAANFDGVIEQVQQASLEPALVAGHRDRLIGDALQVEISRLRHRLELLDTSPGQDSEIDRLMRKGDLA